MSTVDPTRSGERGTANPRAPGGETHDYVEPVPGDGWVLFAASMLGLLAILNFVDGVAAISDSTFFVNDAKFIFSNLNTWGWILVVMGVTQGLTALGLFMGAAGVRWVGVALAALNAIVQLFFISAYPFWSLALFTLDILVIYGLVVHGARRHQT